MTGPEKAPKSPIWTPEQYKRVDQESLTVHTMVNKFLFEVAL